MKSCPRPPPPMVWGQPATGIPPGSVRSSSTVPQPRFLLSSFLPLSFHDAATRASLLSLLTSVSASFLLPLVYVCPYPTPSFLD